jgi:hypothetical protein
MKGLSFQEFYDCLYYGADIDLLYNLSFFHISAGSIGEKHGITVYKYDKNPDQISNFCTEIYDAVTSKVSESVENFLQAKIFDGKSIYDIQNELEILYS